MDSTTSPGKPAFYYSLSCDNGGFDLEEILGYAHDGMARNLLSSTNGGAIGFIAQSRWGWVSSSHLLQVAFFDSLFSHPNLPASIAYQEVKHDLVIYRDLVMGQNYYGDPLVRVYTKVPSGLELTVRYNHPRFEVYVTDGTSVVEECVITVSDDSGVLDRMVTDQNGMAPLPTGLNINGTYTLTASATNAVVTQKEFVPSIVTDVADGDNDLLPTSFSLSQNYPNPFNPFTTIIFELPTQAAIDLSVFNILGQEVTTLVAGELPAGRHTVEWDGTSISGDPVASGIYFYRLTANDYSDLKKMALLK
jgi:hypothetical protein